MGHRNMTIGNKMFSNLMTRMEEFISLMASEKPIERIRSLEKKIDEVDKIQEIEGRIDQIKDKMLTVKEVLTTSEASCFLGLSESYIYKLTASRQIPHYKPNGKLVYFNRKELCEWAMKNQIQPNVQPTKKREVQYEQEGR